MRQQQRLTVNCQHVVEIVYSKAHIHEITRCMKVNVNDLR